MITKHLKTVENKLVFKKNRFLFITFKCSCGLTCSNYRGGFANRFKHWHRQPNFKEATLCHKCCSSYNDRKEREAKKRERARSFQKPNYVFIVMCMRHRSRSIFIHKQNIINRTWSSKKNIFRCFFVLKVYNKWKLDRCGVIVLRF